MNIEMNTEINITHGNLGLLFLFLCNHRQPRLCGSSLDFEFIRECMKINKIRPKFHFSTKNRNKNDLPCVCVLVFTVSSPLVPFGSHFIDV